jgi:hypothetical protein
METNNKLIAEFLGIQIEEGQERIYINGLGTELIEYTFNTDWNWLMEAVEKINDFNNVVSINENHVLIINNERSKVIVDVVAGNMIEATYNAVVEFIKLHNEQ